MDYTEYKKPEYFWNRELSWLGFDERILGERKISRFLCLNG